MQGKEPRHNKTVRFILAIVAFFLGCYVVVNYLIIHISISSNVTDKAGLVATLLLVKNSAVNPLVYAILKCDIKNEMNKAFSPESKATMSNDMSTSTQSCPPS